MAKTKKQPKAPRFESTEKAKKISAMRGQIAALEHEIYAIETTMLNDAAPATGKNADGLVFASHVCPHPDNAEHRCVIDEGDEYGNDCCVFCGGPSDRQ